MTVTPFGITIPNLLGAALYAIMAKSHEELNQTHQRMWKCLQILDNQQSERVILVGCHVTGSKQEYEQSLAELQSLAETAKGEVVASISQKREKN